MSNIDYSDYEFDFNNFKFFREQFDVLTKESMNSLEECINVLRKLVLFQSELTEVSKCASIEYALNQSRDNKDHLQLVFNLFSRIAVFREKLFETFLFNYNLQDSIKASPKEMNNLIRRIYRVKKHYVSFSNDEYYQTLKRTNDILLEISSGNDSLDQLKVYSKEYIELKNKSAVMEKYNNYIDRILFIDDVSSEVFTTLLKVKNDGKEFINTPKNIKLKDSILLITDTLSTYFDESYVNIFNELLNGNSINFDTNSDVYNSSTHAAYSLTPKLMINFDGSIDSLESFIYEVGHAVSLKLQNVNPIFDYDYNIMVGNVFGFVNQFALNDLLKAENSRLYEYSKAYLSNTLGFVKNTLNGLKMVFDLYTDKVKKIDDSKYPLVFDDFSEYRDCLGFVLGAYVFKKIKTGELSKKDYIKLLSLGGNFTIRECFNKVNIELNKTVVTEGLKYIEELIK